MKDAFGKGSWYEAKEPLQAFDPSLFKSGNPVHSHSQVLCRCAGELREKREQQNCGSENFLQLSAVPGKIPEELCQLSLKGLISFFSNPAAAFIRRRLNAVPVEEEEIQLPETEPLFIGWSDFADQEYTCRRILETPEEEQSQLRQELLDRMQSDGKAPLYRQLDSEWPLWNESRELCQIIRPFLGGELRTEKNRIVEIGKFSVALPEMTFYNDVLVLPLFASWEGSVYRFTLTHIAANLLGGAVETMVIGKEKTYRLLPLGSEKAAERMAKILSLYEEGMCEPLCFFPKTSWAVLQYDPDEEIRKIQEVWENENAKFGKYYGDVLPDIGILQNNAERFFANLNMAGEKEE